MHYSKDIVSIASLADGPGLADTARQIDYTPTHGGFEKPAHHSFIRIQGQALSGSLSSKPSHLLHVLYVHPYASWPYME